MFKDVSKFYLVAWGCFIVGIMCLMLNVLADFFNILFAVFFLAGLISIFVKLIINYRQNNKDIVTQKESMAIDMALSNDGSFTVKNSNLTKKQLREFRASKREKFTPILVVLLLIIIMGYLLYRTIMG